MLELEVDGVSTARKPMSPFGKRDLKLRAGRGLGSGSPVKAVRGTREGLGLGLEELGGKDVDVVKHYDADGKRSLLVSCARLACP